MVSSQPKKNLHRHKPQADMAKVLEFSTAT